MIACVRGVLLEAGDGEIIIDVQGIGYRLIVSDTTLRSAPLPGEEIFLYTFTYVREDSLHLYGFLTKAEKRLFESAVSVSGVGPRLAMSILSHATVDGFVRAVLAEDQGALTKIPGIGKKIAARILLELKDKFKREVWAQWLASEHSDTDLSSSHPTGNRVIVDAIEALMGLGYRDDEAKEAVHTIVEKSDEALLTVEEVITLALATLDRVG